MVEAHPTISVVDWSRQKRAILNGEIDKDTRIGEIANMAAHALGMPANVPYSIFISSPNGERLKKLHKADSVSDLELEEDTELMLAPEVSAG